LSTIEIEIDGLLGATLASAAGGEDQAAEAAVLISAAGRLDNLIYHRRMMLASTAVADLEAGLAELFWWRQSGPSGRGWIARPPEALTAGPKAADKAKDAAPQM
jgi:hypothetical protein